MTVPLIFDMREVLCRLNDITRKSFRSSTCTSLSQLQNVTSVSPTIRDRFREGLEHLSLLLDDWARQRISDKFFLHKYPECSELRWEDQWVTSIGISRTRRVSFLHWSKQTECPRYWRKSRTDVTTIMNSPHSPCVGRDIRVAEGSPSYPLLVILTDMRDQLSIRKRKFATVDDVTCVLSQMQTLDVIR